MALKSLEMASDGLLSTGGRNSLVMAAQGMLGSGVIAAVAQKFRGFAANVGRLMGT